VRIWIPTTRVWITSFCDEIKKCKKYLEYLHTSKALNKAGSVGRLILKDRKVSWNVERKPPAFQ
jgi:hypothetical protein